MLSTLARAAYPNLQNVSAPSPDPGAQLGWDAYTPPVDDALTPAANAPIFGEWTRTGDVDDTLVVTGYGFSNFSGADMGKDTVFRVYGQTTAGDGVEKNGKMQRLKNNDRAAVTLDSSLPSWSMYLMWPKNGNGWGYPVAVNRTDAWWAGPKLAKAGETVSVFGRNLAHDNGTSTSWIYLKPAAGPGQWVTPSSVNPYQVSFTVPSLDEGDYQVWAHNGHGGAYGWSGPLTLTVWAAPRWTSNVIDVDSFGAIPDDGGDDTAAINSALAAAAAAGDFSTLSFSSGVYNVAGASISPRIKVRWRGAGKDETTISSSFNGHMIYGDGFGGATGAYFCFENLSLESTYSGGLDVAVLYLPNVKYVWLNNVRISTHRRGLYFGGSEHIIMRDSEFVCGFYAIAPGKRQTIIDHCDFRGQNGTPTYICPGPNTEEMAVTNCTVRDVDSSTSSGCAQGRWISCCGSNGGSVGSADFRNIYIGGNVTHDMGPILGDCDAEQIQWERFDSYFHANATDTSTPGAVDFVTCALGANYVGKTAIIVGGKGIGQRRNITGFNAATATLEVSPAWSITPDGTSHVMISDVAEQIAIYDNILDGKADIIYQEFNGSQGIEPYANSFDIVADGNHGSDLRKGIIANWSLAKDSVRFDPCYFNLYVNNTSENCYTGIGIVATCSSSMYSGTNNLGNIYRNNTLNNTLDVAWRLQNAVPFGQPYSGPADWFDMTVFEHNTITNAKYGVKFEQTAPGATFCALLYKNSIDRGSAAYDGSIAIDVPYSGHSLVYRENTWSNFETTYAGANQPGAVLEVPYRYFALSGTAGGAARTATLTLWNSGSAPLNWTAAVEGAPQWLTLSSANGTLGNEMGSANLTITANPHDLGEGTYNATIALTCNGTITRKAMVTFTVNAPILVKPDLLVKTRADADFLGDDIYNDTGALQEACASAPAGNAATFDFIIQNDGEIADSFKITAPAGGGGWTVRYYKDFDDFADITDQVTGAGWITPMIPVGESLPFLVEVTADASVAGYAQKALPVRAQSALLAGAVEVARAVATNLPIPCVDAAIQNDGGLMIGTGLYGCDGAGQSVSRSLLTNQQAQFAITLTNRGNIPDGYLVTAPAGAPNWAVQYLDDAGNDITGAVTADGFSVDTLAVGESYTIRVNVTPSQFVPAGGSLELLVHVSSAADAGVCDAVMAVGVKAPISAVSVYADPIEGQAVGQQINLFATPVGGSDIEYKFTCLDPAGQTTLIRDYGAGRNCAWTPEMAGAHQVTAWAREVGSPAPFNASATITYNVIPAMLSAVAVDAAMQADKTWLFTATPTDGLNVQYKFRVLSGSTWADVQAYSAESACRWRPAKAGAYTVRVYAKETRGRVTVETFADKTFRVTAVPPPPPRLTAVRLAAAPASPRPVNTPITLTATPVGGTNVEFRFRVYDGKTWIDLQPYGPAKTIVWTPEAKKTYTIAVYAHEVGSSMTTQVTTSIKFVIQ